MRDFKKYTSKAMIEGLNRINESRKEWVIRAFTKAADKIKRVTSYKICPARSHFLCDCNLMREAEKQQLYCVEEGQRLDRAQS